MEIINAAQLCFYGLPSALVLADALANRSDNLPLSWPELHHQLSVLSTELEALVDFTDSNYALYSRQKEALSRQLDRALHTRLEMSPSKSLQFGGTLTAPLNDIDKMIAEMAEDETFADGPIGDLESSSAGTSSWTLDEVFDDCLWKVSE